MGPRISGALATAACTMLLPSSGADEPLALEKTVPLPGVRGRIDHMDFDAETGRLFIAAIGNGSLEVVDLRKGERLRSIAGLAEPQGVLFVGNLKGITSCVIVACGGDGAAHIFDPVTLEPIRTVGLAPEADNIRRGWDQVYVGCGTGDSSAIARFSIASGGLAGVRVERIALPGHPEGFQLLFSPGPREARPKAHPDRHEVRAVVNLPSSREVAVIDLETSKVVAQWALKDAGSNFPMCGWEEPPKDDGPTTDRIGIGCRQPSRVLLFDAARGAQLAAAPCAGDVDDLLLSGDHSRLYAVCGGDGGAVACYAITPETIEQVARVATCPGARTGREIMLDDQEAIAVACPVRGEQPAAIRIYRPTAPPAHR